MLYSSINNNIYLYLVVVVGTVEKWINHIFFKNTVAVDRRQVPDLYSREESPTECLGDCG
jgi:hypothetical protein